MYFKIHMQVNYMMCTILSFLSKQNDKIPIFLDLTVIGTEH